MTSIFIKSTIWSICQRYLPSVVQIIATLVITRMITPSDFGEVALITTFYQIAILLVSSGLGDGLMFKVDNSEIRYSSVFYFNLAIAGFAYTILFFSSNYIAAFYNISRLSILVQVISINILLYAASYLPRVIFQKNLNFKILAYASIIATLIGSSIGICLAFRGYGIWSIVMLTLTINFLETSILWIKSKWRPLLQFSWFEVKAILPYSLKILTNNIIQVIYDNIYSLVIGKSIGIRPLGFFNRMQTVVYFTTTNFMYSIENVFFPILCRNKKDESHIRDAYEKLLRISTLLSSFILIILIILANQIVVIILTETWSEGIPVLRMMSIAFLFVPISYINNSFLKISNKTKILLYGNIVKKTIGLIILAITVSFGDFYMICKGVIVYYSVDAVISMYLTHFYLHIKITDQISYLRNNLLFGIIAIVCALPISLVHSVYVSCFLGLLIVCTVYAAGSVILKTKEFLIIRQIMFQMTLPKK